MFVNIMVLVYYEGGGGERTDVLSGRLMIAFSFVCQITSGHFSM